jgi:hypothetical protein
MNENHYLYIESNSQRVCMRRGTLACSYLLALFTAMRLLILSDLHHEVWREHAPRIDPALSRPDVVVLAGDIDTGAKAVAWAAHTFAGLPVLYVHGNHEGYGHNLDGYMTRGGGVENARFDPAVVVDVG